MDDYNRKSRKWIIVVSIFILAFLCIGLCIEALYSLPDGDDFKFFYMMKQGIETGKSAFFSALDVSIELYQNWSGDYLSTFLLAFFDPFRRNGLFGVSFMCFLGTVFFVGSLEFFWITLGKKVGKFQDKALPVFLLIITGGWLDSCTPKENFYWYTCVYSYTLGLGIVILEIAFLLRNENGKKTSGWLEIVWSVIAFFGGVLSAGLSIPTLAISVGFFLYFFCFECQRNWKVILSWGAGIFVSAIIVLSAPGNHVRNAYGMVEEMPLVQQFPEAIWNSTKCLARIGVKQILASPFFWIMIVFLICARVFWSKDWKRPSLSTLLKKIIFGCMLIYSGVLPVCFGYHTSFLSPRTESMAVAIIWIVIFDWIITGLRFLPIGESLKISKYVSTGVLIIAGAMALLCLVATNNAGRLAYQELISGKPQLQWDNWNHLYQSVETSTDPIVTVSFDNDYITDLMVRHDEVLHDGEWEISYGYMDYCGKDQVVVNWYGDDMVHTLNGFKRKSE